MDKLETLNLKNGYVFNFNLNKKRTIYFGANGVGKTQTANAITNYFERNNEKAIVFKNNIMEGMLAPDDESVEISPRASDLNKINLEIAACTNIDIVNATLKDLCGSCTIKFYNSLGFNLIEPELKRKAFLLNGIYANKYTKDVIGDLFSLKGSNDNFFNMAEKFKGLSRYSVRTINDIIDSGRTDVLDVQKAVIDEKMTNCPVCNSELTEEKLDFIKRALNKLRINKELKESIIAYYQNANTEHLVLDMFKNSKDIDNWLLGLKKDVEYSLISIIQSKINPSETAILQSLINEKEKIEEEIKDFKVKAHSKAIKEKILSRIKNNLEKHPCFKGKTYNVEIKQGKIFINNPPVKYSDMSTSEQNFYSFIYFDALIYSIGTNGDPINIVIDDPFDSYDSSHVWDCISILNDVVENNEDVLNYVQIFSHSLDIFSMYMDMEYFNKNFKLVWLDKVNDSNEIKQYIDDKSLIFNRKEKNLSDLRIAKAILLRCGEPAPLICACLLLRNLTEFCKTVFTGSEKDSCRKFFNYVSEHVDHYRKGDYTHLKNLSNALNKLFQTLIPFSYIGTIRNYFDNEIDESKLETYDIKIDLKDAKSNDLLRLLVFKLVLAVKCRRLMEEYIWDNYENDIKIKYPKGSKNLTIGNLIGVVEDKNSNDVVINLYRKNRRFINTFCHSSCENISPIFVYNLNNIQECYIEIKSTLKI